MTSVYFLEASVPLTKTFRQLKDGKVQKDAYPLVANVTSHEESIKNIDEFYKAILFHAAAGHCLLKGELSRPLTNESRRGTTATDDRTSWICLDFDRHECTSIDEELHKLGVGDVSYVLQYSASHGLDEHDGTQSAHVFMLLDGAIPAPELKGWLMSLNFKQYADHLRLSRSQTVLSYPLDITTCQNDKLLYIATPNFVKPLTDPLQQRISIVAKKYGKLPVARVTGNNINALKTQERKILNELRKAVGLPARNARTAWVGPIEVQNKPDVCQVTEIREQGEFVRLNLNGGDSWAYWHHRENFELIHDFKTDTWYRTKELVPGYYQKLVEERSQRSATPTENGDLVLAFRDLKTAEYYNGLWNPDQNRLELHRAKNETQLDHWMRSHGLFLGEFIPVWDIQYTPREDWKVDADGHKINLFNPSEYMYLEADEAGAKKFPTIIKIIEHMLGADKRTQEDKALVAHFLNWFNCIFQRVHKPLTAWVAHGIEGTGKGYFVNKIAVPLLNRDNVSSVLAQNIEDNFNAWQEGKLLIFVDEIDVDDFREKGRITAKLRNHITEPTIMSRRMRSTAVTVPNYASYLFSSNQPTPAYIPETDRRYNVGNFQRAKLPRPDDDMVESELQAFAQWLLSQKPDIEKANAIIHTEARAKIAKLSVTSLVETCTTIRNGDFESLWMAMPDEKLMNEAGIVNAHTQNAMAYVMLMRRIASEILQTLTTRNSSVGVLSRDELFIILQYNVGNMPVTPNKFTSLLRHNNIDTVRVRTNGKLGYGINVEWQISNEFKSELEAILPKKSKGGSQDKKVTPIKKAS